MTLPYITITAASSHGEVQLQLPRGVRQGRPDQLKRRGREAVARQAQAPKQHGQASKLRDFMSDRSCRPRKLFTAVAMLIKLLGKIRPAANPLRVKLPGRRPPDFGEPSPLRSSRASSRALSPVASFQPSSSTERAGRCWQTRLATCGGGLGGGVGFGVELKGSGFNLGDVSEALCHAPREHMTCMSFQAYPVKCFAR